MDHIKARVSASLVAIKVGPSELRSLFQACDCRQADTDKKPAGRIRVSRPAEQVNWQESVATFDSTQVDHMPRL